MPSRKELDGAKNSFPAVLDLIENYAGDKLTGVKLEEIEWYHRIRNEIYHAGHGVTVEIAKVQTYLELAIVFFENLFGTKLRLASVDIRQQRIGNFLALWNQAEMLFRAKRPPKPSGDYAYYWNRECLQELSPRAFKLWEDLLQFRNTVVHDPETKSADFERASEDALELVELLESWNL